MESETMANSNTSSAGNARRGPIRRVSVCFHSFYGVSKSITRGFEKRPEITASNISYEYVPYVKARSQSFLRRIRYRGKSARLNAEALRSIREFDPDLVVVVEGACLAPETINELRAERRIVLWCIESLKRLNLQPALLREFDQVFCFEPRDFESLPESSYLPMGFDDDIYHPSSKQNRIYDLVWVGSGHNDRIDRLENIALMSAEGGFNFGVFGPIYNKKNATRFQASFPNLHRCVVENRRIQPSEANDIFNEAHLALNLHSLDETEAAYNPRTWEAPAASSVLLTDWKDAMRGEVIDGENAFVFESVGELKTRIPSILEDRDKLEQVRSTGTVVAREKHTFAARAKSLLDQLRTGG